MSIFTTKILPVGLILAVFASVAISLVAMTEVATHERIAENERQTLLAAINALVKPDDYDNAILADTLTLPATTQLATQQDTIVYRARQDGQAIAAIFTSIAPNGYNGKIKLLVGVYYDGSLAGVRVISHKETPGLGDKIDVKKSDWILRFAGLSPTNPTVSKWVVKKDGGVFDQFTGATITPRAVVSAVHNALVYFAGNRDALFKESN